MKKANPALLLAVAITLCTNSALAQGTMLATWHNQNGPIQGNLFQASFQIYDSEMAPGADFSVTRLFDQTLTVASPDHVFPALGPGAQIEAGPTGGGSGFTDSGGSLYLCAGLPDLVSPGYAAVVYAGDIYETKDNGSPNPTILYHESGYWMFTAVPEPSSAALLVLGLLALLRKKAISLP